MTTAELAPSQISDRHLKVRYERPLPQCSFSILIIDDDSWFRLLVRTFLEKTSFRILESQSGVEGIATLRRTRVDLVIVDMVMPGQGGIATIAAARSLFPSLKILAVSGALDKDYYLHAAGLHGADLTLKKPVTKESLLEALSRLAQS